VAFRDRTDAGRQLAARLARYQGHDVVVLGLPRGGVPVAFEVAQALHAPLDVWVARKIGAPGRPELGIGAIAEGGALFLDHEMADAVGATGRDVARIAEREGAELARRVRHYRGDRPPPALSGRTVIVVDDGIATGGTVRAVVQAVRMQRPGRLVLAAPVAAAQTLASLRSEVDDLVCVLAPSDLVAVGRFYADFRQTQDEEVCDLLERARQGMVPTH
jgi:putative phosphoribosyl transferase